MYRLPSTDSSVCTSAAASVRTQLRLPVAHIERVSAAAAEHAVRNVKHHRQIRRVAARLQHRGDVENPQPQRVLHEGGPNQSRIGQQIRQHIVRMRPGHHLLDQVHAEQDPPQCDVRLRRHRGQLGDLDLLLLVAVHPVHREAVGVQQTEERGAAVPELLAVGEHLVPQPARAVQAARRLQPPPLVDLLQLFAVLRRPHRPDAAGVGDVVVEPGLPPVDGQLTPYRRGPVSEPAVDACLAGLQSGDRIVAHPAVQFGEHRRQRAASPMCRRDRHPGQRRPSAARRRQAR